MDSDRQRRQMSGNTRAHTHTHAKSERQKEMLLRNSTLQSQNIIIIKNEKEETFISQGEIGAESQKSSAIIIIMVQMKGNSFDLFS